MKVFISWSGKRSKAVATALPEILTGILPNIRPWVSAHNIGAGARWLRKLDEELETTDCGIVCVTPDNAGAPWLNYEVGALAKRVKESAVIPYLIGMESATEVPDGPLSGFQAKIALTETWEVVLALNKLLGESQAPESSLQNRFGKWWPDLESVLTQLPAPTIAKKGPELPDMVREILETVRELARGPLRATDRNEFITPALQRRINLVSLGVIPHPVLRKRGMEVVGLGTNNGVTWFVTVSRGPKRFTYRVRVEPGSDIQTTADAIVAVLGGQGGAPPEEEP